MHLELQCDPKKTHMINVTVIGVHVFTCVSCYSSRKEGPEGVKWELGLACFCPGKMGFRSLGLGFDHCGWEKCQKWEWDKSCVTMTSRDITSLISWG